MERVPDSSPLSDDHHTIRQLPRLDGQALGRRERTQFLVTFHQELAQIKPLPRRNPLLLALLFLALVLENAELLLEVGDSSAEERSLHGQTK